MIYKITIHCLIRTPEYCFKEACKVIEIPFLPFAGLGIDTGDIWGKEVIGEPLFDNNRNIYGIKGIYYNPARPDEFDVYIGPDDILIDNPSITVESRCKFYESDGWTVYNAFKEWEE
jgi:hypothetical protein